MKADVRERVFEGEAHDFEGAIAHVASARPMLPPRSHKGRPHPPARRFIGYNLEVIPHSIHKENTGEDLLPGTVVARIDELTFAVRRGGLWFIEVHGELSPEVRAERGARLLRTRKKQASTEELRRLGLQTGHGMPTEAPPPAVRRGPPAPNRRPLFSRR